MSDDAYGTPLIVRDSASPMKMRRVSLGGRGDGLEYDEAFIQKLAFGYPECLPVSEIDVAYKDLVPVCMELTTPAGPLDALFVTSSGRLVAKPFT